MDSLLTIVSKENALVVTKIEQYQHDVNQVKDITLQFIKEKQIYLDPRGNLVNIHFELQSKDNFSDYNYAYRIKGVEDEWVPFYEPYIQLNHLPFGILQLEVKSLRSNSSTPSYLLIPIVSKKPFYLSYAFIMGLISFLVFFCLLLFLWIKKRILSQQQTLEYKIENTLNQMLATQKSNTELIPSNQISDIKLELPSSRNSFYAPKAPNQDEGLAAESVPENQTNGEEPSPTQSLSLKQEAWLSNLKILIKENLNHHQFNTEFVASQVDLSRRQLQRRLKEVTGLSPKDYIKDIRMNEAKNLLENQTCDSVKEVAERIGLSNVTHFTEIYTQYFGNSPKDYFQPILK